MQILTKDEAAKALGISEGTLDAWRWKGIGPEYIKFPKRIVYSIEAIESYIRSNTHRPSVQAFMEDRRVTV